MSMYPPKRTPNFRCVSTTSDLWCFPNNKLAPRNYVPNHILTLHFTNCFLVSAEPRWSASSGPRGGRSQQWKIIYLLRSIEVEYIIYIISHLHTNWIYPRTRAQYTYRNVLALSLRTNSGTQSTVSK